MALEVGQIAVIPVLDVMVAALVEARTSRHLDPVVGRGLGVGVETRASRSAVGLGNLKLAVRGMASLFTAFTRVGSGISPAGGAEKQSTLSVHR